ncbi:MAG TPA: hypothetical protein VGF97_13850 [Rhizomicrobium sp.]
MDIKQQTRSRTPAQRDTQIDYVVDDCGTGQRRKSREGCRHSASRLPFPYRTQKLLKRAPSILFRGRPLGDCNTVNMRRRVNGVFRNDPGQDARERSSSPYVLANKNAYDEISEAYQFLDFILESSRAAASAPHGLNLDRDLLIRPRKRQQGGRAAGLHRREPTARIDRNCKTELHLNSVGVRRGRSHENKIAERPRESGALHKSRTCGSQIAAGQHGDAPCRRRAPPTKNLMRPQVKQGIETRGREPDQDNYRRAIGGFGQLPDGRIFDKLPIGDVKTMHSCMIRRAKFGSDFCYQSGAFRTSRIHDQQRQRYVGPIAGQNCTDFIGLSRVGR